MQEKSAQSGKISLATWLPARRGGLQALTAIFTLRDPIYTLWKSAAHFSERTDPLWEAIYTLGEAAAALWKSIYTLGWPADMLWEGADRLDYPMGDQQGRHYRVGKRSDSLEESIVVR